jgi:hypothetical protein
MTVSRLLCLISVVIAAGCAATNAPDSRLGGQTVETTVPAATFKLDGYQLVWRENTNLDTQMRCAMSSVTLDTVCSRGEVIKKRAAADTDHMNKLLNAHAPARIKEQLASVGQKEGARTLIEVAPQKGYWSEAGWGSGVIVRATVKDVTTGASWTHEVPADTGIQFFGATAASPETPEFAATFAKRLVRVFDEAGLLKRP